MILLLDILYQLYKRIVTNFMNQITKSIKKMNQNIWPKKEIFWKVKVR